jgi:hypothetical protein
MADQLMAQLLSSWQEDFLRAEYGGWQGREADVLGWLGQVPNLLHVLPSLLSRGQKVRRRFAVVMLYGCALQPP